MLFALTLHHCCGCLLLLDPVWDHLVLGHFDETPFYCQCAVAAEQYLSDTKALLLRANLLKHDFAQKQGDDAEHGHGRGRGGRRGGHGQGPGGGGGGGGLHAAALLGSFGNFGGYPDVA